jgi:hypothetical protein
VCSASTDDKPKYGCPEHKGAAIEEGSGLGREDSVNELLEGRGPVCERRPGETEVFAQQILKRLGSTTKEVDRRRGNEKLRVAQTPCRRDKF